MATEVHSTETIFEFTGGALCLDFSNTLEGRAKPQNLKDNLGSYRDLVAWAKQSKSLTAKEAAKLLLLAQGDTAKATQVLRLAQGLRETIYRAFSAIASNKSPSAADLQMLNTAYAGAVKHSRLTFSKDRYVHEWLWENDVLARPLWPVVQDAVDLLRSEHTDSVRECVADDCAWLFLDKSRNQSRRWCDMKVCGNREKARRHHERQNT